MKIATPTWRFYFGSTTAPSCLVVHQYLSAYAVQLPFGSDLDHFLQKPTECACPTQQPLDMTEVSDDLVEASQILNLPPTQPLPVRSSAADPHCFDAGHSSYITLKEASSSAELSN
ncbi:unnamed protein product [Phytophthora lilii]|uniref:Unnamed protein product n=1 Tax=Phytophthora lilii TaxID=2077276 RepID=A0A9W7CME4_9STRA|nr:unnamed protein product [Phytophthora lilii]